MINILRKNIGTVVAIFGFFILCIITFGDIGTIATDAYWKNVYENLMSISFMSIGLSLVQLVVKQGISEQALQKGINTEITRAKYEEHKQKILSCNDRMIYLPYFLQVYNARNTKILRQDFLVNNSFSTEQALYQSARKTLIKKYEKIKVNMMPSKIKWSTTEIVYNKQGHIQTLKEYRTKRLILAFVKSVVFMLGMTLFAQGLFFETSGEPIWQKFVKLGGYVFVIIISSIFDVTKEYEKGAFGIPNELDEVNEIWNEFYHWKIPDDIKKEVEDEQKSERNDSRTDIQEQQEKIENI